MYLKHSVEKILPKIENVKNLNKAIQNNSEMDSE